MPTNFFELCSLLRWAVSGGTLSVTNNKQHITSKNQTHQYCTTMTVVRDGTTEDMGYQKLIVAFRGQKIELPTSPELTVGQVKSAIADATDDSVQMSPSDVKLLFKGKVLSDDDDRIMNVLGAKSAKVYRLIATGMSTMEQSDNQKHFEEGLKRAPRIRDDITNEGQQEMIRRRHMGQAMLRKAAARGGGSQHKYCFGAIETLPNLPEENKARQILTQLANDVGVLACMAKHQWNVGCLAELYPDGKVGESAVCVMGLNQNRGQKILLRLRTDDLKGFRKILSIRKVLFHELAHNVHSDHDDKFFQLMRQIERECNELDWTQGSGTSTTNNSDQVFEAGTHRLGGTMTDANLSARELAGRAAIMRLTSEEQEIYNGCGCGRESKFLPPSGGTTSWFA